MWPAALPLMAGGQRGAKGQETGKTARNREGFDCGKYCFNWLARRKGRGGGGGQAWRGSRRRTVG
jgi:hypothetical protein